MPNVDTPNKVTYYRSVACCNTIYKVIAKILSVRLQRVHVHVVDVAQRAFVKDRSMAHNILSSQELLPHYARQSILFLQDALSN